MPHPGILAKFLRAAAVADACGGHALNLVIDTGVERVGEIDVPVGHPPSQLSVETISMLGEHEGMVAFRPPGVVRPPAVPDGVMESVARGIETIAAAWESATGSTAAEQAASAVGGVLRPHVGGLSVVFASRLLASPIGTEMLAAMRSDPEGCVRIYNEAVAAYPDAGVRLLQAGRSVELPLWRVDGGTIRPAMAQDLDAPPEHLLPRALASTALVRAAVADHFVHGLGGWAYDRIMERWMSRWLGWSLCPRSLATATMRLPGCSDPDIEHALQRGHLTFRRLRHDPHGGGDGALSPEKAAMLREIEATGAGTSERHAAFQHMHQRLDQAASKADLGHARAELAAARQSIRIAARRTWAFPLYPFAA
jgi:hypothetical protein